MITVTLIRKHFIGASLHFRGLVHYDYDRKCLAMQADMELERELRVLHPSQQEESETLGI